MLLITGKIFISDLEDTLRALHECLPRRCAVVANSLTGQPRWFQQMVDQTAIDVIESRFQLHVPESVRLFYRYSAYALFIRAHHETDVFMPPNPGESSLERPIMTESSYPPWIAIGESPHTGQLLMVELDTDEPRVSWRGFYSSGDDFVFPNSFEDWLLQGAAYVLQNTGPRAECSRMGDSDVW